MEIEFGSFLEGLERKVISMGASDFIQEALLPIQAIEDSFSADSQTSSDALRFEENLNHILEVLLRARQVDNRLLIELEKFYQNASLLIGLSGLRLNKESFQAWRAYDHWHYEAVKSQLQVYGPSMIL